MNDVMKMAKIPTFHCIFHKRMQTASQKRGISEIIHKERYKNI